MERMRKVPSDLRNVKLDKVFKSFDKNVKHDDICDQSCSENDSDSDDNEKCRVHPTGNINVDVSSNTTGYDLRPRRPIRYPK